jgi:dCTP deaminase
MILSDRSIKESIASGRIAITPYEEVLVQPASIDIRLDGRFLVFRNYKYTCIDPKALQPDLTEMIEVGQDEPFIVHPGEFILGSTIERIALGDDLVGRLEGKSSLGRLGLIVHATAGYIDPGFDGNITLELSNVANLPIRLYPGMKVGQISFFAMSTPADRPYGHPSLGSKYKGPTVPTASRMHLNFSNHLPSNNLPPEEEPQ